ncbi:MAG: MFS transporter [Myxococcota bacterium]
MGGGSSGGLWRNADFVRLWSAATVTNFGSMIRRIALPFVAILVLDATPKDIAILAAASMLPGFVLGLLASARIDRLRKRPILIASDLLRALLMLTVPLAAWQGWLRMEHLYVVSLLAGFLSFLFDVAHTSYLPTLVERRELVAANSRLKAAEAVTEAGAFASGGWLVQILSAPLALLVDSLSFLTSAAILSRIRTQEPEPPPTHDSRVLTEVREGLGFVARSPALRPLAISSIVAAFSFQVYSTAYLLFVNQELGFAPGTLGTIFAVGAASSFAGALAVAPTSRRLGLGNAMAGGLVLVCLTMALLPFAPGATLLGVLLLVLHQLGDGAEVVFQVNAVSLLQATTPHRMLGRVNGTFHFSALGAMLLGTALGGALGETLGLRATLLVGAVGVGVAAACLGLSRVGRLRETPALEQTTAAP